MYASMPECMYELVNWLFRIANKGCCKGGLLEISQGSAHCDDNFQFEAQMNVGIVHTSNAWCPLVRFSMSSSGRARSST